MRIVRILRFLPFAVLLCFGTLWAQPCQQPYQYDYPGCLGLMNVPAQPNTPNATNTYVWPASVPGATLVSGQGTQNAVYDFTNVGNITINVVITSSQYSCTYTRTHHFYIPDFSTPQIQGAAVPGTCTGNTVYTYYATRWRSCTTGFCLPHHETHTWTINGGTIVSQTLHNQIGGSPYGYGTTDTIKVQWNGTGMRRLILQRYGSHDNVNVPGPSNCFAYDTLMPATGPAVMTGLSSGCNVTSATYTVNADTGYTYTWTVTGNGTLASGQGTTSATVNWTGSGMVKVVKSFLWCNQSYADSISFVGGPTPTPNLGPNGTFCQGSNFTLNAGPGSTYAWSTGATTPTIQPTASGTYSVTVSNGPGCTGTSSVTLTMLPQPVPTISSFPMQVCAGGQMTLDAGIWAAYLWSTGANTSSITVTPPGTYSVTVTDFSGCTGSATINVIALPGPSPFLPANQSVCAGTPIIFNPGNFTSYIWSNGAFSQTISPTTSGTYTVTVTDVNGCTGSATTNLTVNPNPTPNLGPNQTVCAGTSITLNPGTYVGYAWSNNAASPTISPTTSGLYDVTVTDANGCTGSSSTTVTFNPLPTFSLGADTFMCADTFVTISGPAGMASYLWNTNATAPNITVSLGGNYDLTVTDANGCTATDDKLVTALTDCVFPGDANYDGVADNADILAIGAYYGYTGGSRPGAVLSWYGQSLPDWGGALPGNADPKHSDCDGNGTVAAVDTQAVTLNYGLTHSKGAGITGGPVQLTVRALADSVFPGDPAWFVVEMGDAQNVADSVYGIALRMSPSGNAMAAPGIIRVDYTNCWFASGTDRLDFTQALGSSAPVDLAVVRKDQNEQSGFGELLRFAVATDPNLVPVRDILQIGLSNVLFVDANLTAMPLTVTNGSVVVSHLVTGLPTSGMPQPVVYPNPTNGDVRIHCIGANALEVVAVDALGQLVKTMRNETGNSLVMETHDLAAGIYLLRIKTESGTFMKRLVVE